jgi:hypothetical protein
MVDGLHILIWNSTKKPLAIALNEEGGGGGGEGRCDLTNVQCKPIQNYHNEAPMYYEYILLKKKLTGNAYNFKNNVFINLYVILMIKTTFQLNTFSYFIYEKTVAEKG